MRGNAVVGQLFHLFGTDLNFDRYPVHAEQGGMQGLVAVGLGNRDVVLEAAREGLVQAVHGAEHAVAGVGLVDDDAEGVDVHDLVERLLLAAHLLVDAVQVLLAAHHLALQPFALQTGLQRLENAVEQVLAIAPGVAHGAVDQH